MLQETQHASGLWAWMVTMVPMRRKNVSSSVPLQSVDVAPVPSKKKCDTNKTAIGMVPRFVTTLRDFCSGLNISNYFFLFCELPTPYTSRKKKPRRNCPANVAQQESLW